MIRKAVATTFSLAAAASAAVADPQLAYVDAIVVAGGPDPGQARVFAEALVHRAGLRPRFADASAPRCGDDGPCLAARARGIGATIGVRLTIAEIGDELVASMLVADSGRIRIRRKVASGIDLGRPDESLVAILRGEPRTNDAATRPTLFRVGLITGVVGIASASTGVYFASRARGGWDEITRLSSDHGIWNDHYDGVEADAKQSERLAIILVAAGTTAVVTGAVLWYVGSRRGREHPSLIVVPDHDGAKASATWRF